MLRILSLFYREIKEQFYKFYNFIYTDSALAKWWLGDWLINLDSDTCMIILNNKGRCLSNSYLPKYSILPEIMSKQLQRVFSRLENMWWWYVMKIGKNTFSKKLFKSNKYIYVLVAYYRQLFYFSAIF